MTKNHRAPGSDEIDELISIDVGQNRPIGLLDESRHAADGAKRPDGRVNPTDQTTLGLGEESFRAGYFHSVAQRRRGLTLLAFPLNRATDRKRFFFGRLLA